MKRCLNLQISNLRSLYLAEELNPVVLAEYLLERDHRDLGIWIEPPNKEWLLKEAQALAQRRGEIEHLPLYGIPFAVKDNIDVAGMPTSAACPAYSYFPGQDAVVVARLRQAGAFPIGKTNMDQFATGLVGVRTPYGPGRNPFNREYIAGGSSSGSAIAVAKGLASFALGTDTAGSGRVPAAFNNLVGLKPSRGRISNRGVVPACRSLDCISIFSLTVADAWSVLQATSGFDSIDPFSRPVASGQLNLTQVFRFAVPTADQLDFDGDQEAARLFREQVDRLQQIGGEKVEVDFSPLFEAASMLYDGAWVAERAHAIQMFRKEHADDLHPTVAGIISRADNYSAIDTYDAYYRLKVLRRRAELIWQQADILVTPTAPTIYRIDEVLEQPITLNSRLGYYTNFVNLMDLSAIAVPAGFRPDGLPQGISLLAPAWEESVLCELAGRLESLTPSRLGATEYVVDAADCLTHLPKYDPINQGLSIELAVVGAHLRGQPLHSQLMTLMADFIGIFQTADTYRLYALDNTVPAKPGLVKDSKKGASLEVELYRLTVEAFGQFVADIPAPLGMGTVTLEDGRNVKGFICEPWAIQGAREITQYGGWRSYLTALSAQQAITQE